MALDEHGNIYATYKSLVVVSPAGELIGRLPLDEKPANCTFGGADGRTLFVTARTSLYSAAANVRGRAAGVQRTGRRGGQRTGGDQNNHGRATSSCRFPVSWKQGKPSNRLRLAQFEIPAAEGDNEAGELVVSRAVRRQ